MSQLDLSEMQVCGEQLLAVLAGDGMEAVTLQRLHDMSQQVAALRNKQLQQLKDDVQYLTSELNETCDIGQNCGDSNLLDGDLTNIETALKNRLETAQSQSATVVKECQQLKEQLTKVQKEMNTLREQRQSDKDAKKAALPKARCDANLYSNITNLRWQYNSEPHEIKGFITNKQDVKTFNLNSRELSRFFITNYLWDLIEEDW